MKIEEVFIQGFRNLKDIPYLSTAKLNLFVGDNAQGKTNFLEALYVTLRGESFRYYSTKKDWLPAAENSPYGVCVRIQSDLGNKHQIETRCEGTTIRFLLNEKKISPAILRAKHPIVIFSPDDHHLIRGEPEQRRLFIEDVLSDGVPGYSEHLGV